MSGAQVGRAEWAGVETIRTGLIGRDILASRSPWMHQQEAAAQSLPLSYELFDFTDRQWPDMALGARLDELLELGFSGVNVTHPFKQAVIPCLDALAPSAASVGAVNTVQFRDGQKVGHNTDVTGFAESARRGLGQSRLGKVVQFGAGGAGAATAHALLSLGTTELRLADVDAERCAALVQRLSACYPDARVIAVELAPTALDGVDGVVNATPIGMARHPGMPFDAAWLRPDFWVADIVYFPLETQLLRAARAAGCQTLDGRGMAVFQAADAFDIFTGRNADRARMLSSFDAFASERIA